MVRTVVSDMSRYVGIVVGIRSHGGGGQATDGTGSLGEKQGGGAVATLDGGFQAGIRGGGVDGRGGGGGLA